MIRTYHTLLAKLRKARFAPTKYILDNECSAKLKEAIREICTLQLVPPGNHRANLAEVAIKTFKQHFLSVLAGLVPEFSWSYWDVILPQALLQLNLLRKLNATPTVLAHAYLCGQHDYNTIPLLPIGSSAKNSQPVWYLYTSEEHNHTHIYLMKKSKSTRLSDTAVHCTKCHTDPTVTQGNSMVNAVSKLADTISTFAGNRENDANMTDLQTLAQTVQSLAEKNKDHASLPVHAPRLPEVLAVKDVVPQDTQPQAVREPSVTKAVKFPSV